MTIKADSDGAVFVSTIYSQAVEDGDWADYTATAKFKGTSLDILDTSTSTSCVIDTHENVDALVDGYNYLVYDGSETKMITAAVPGNVTSGTLDGVDVNSSNVNYITTPYKSITTEVTSPHGLAFSSDGTKMYAVGQNTDTVYQYPLSIPWDVNSAGSTNANKSVASEASQTLSLTFSSDGTKMYIADYASDFVYQYPLSTAWDLSTCGVTNASRDITEEIYLSSVAFSIDGYSMYIIGIENNTVYQYPLSIAWDLSSSGATNASKLVSSEDSSSLEVRFSSDGKVMFIMGSANDTIYQYPLTVAWDLSTCGASNANQPIFEETAPTSLCFSSKGDRLYVIGTGSDTVYEYTLPNSWDINVVLYKDIASKSVTVNESSLFGVSFSSDGLKMYIVGDSSDKVFQYPLSVAWELSTAGVTNANKLVSGEDLSPYDVTFSSDGTKMYVLGSASDTVYQYPLSTAWDLSSCGVTNANKVVSGEEITAAGIFFSTDGLKMYIVGVSSNTVYQYPLSTAWDLSTCGATNASKSVSADVSAAYSLSFNNDGTTMYVLNLSTDTLFQYPLTIPWDLSTCGATNSNKSLTTENSSPVGITFSIDGTKMYMAGNTGDIVYQYEINGSINSYNTDTLDISSLSLANTPTAIFDIKNTPSPKIALEATGNVLVDDYALTNCYAVGDSLTQTTILDYDSDKPLSIYTDIVLMNSVETNGELLNVSAVAVTDMINRVMSGMSYSSTAYISIGGLGLNFKPNGLEFYTYYSGVLYQFDLSTPWLFSSINTTYIKSKSIPGYATAYNFQFSINGDYFYIVQSSIIYAHSLSVPWDISTINSTASHSKDFSTTDSSIRAFCFSNDGFQLYVAGTVLDNVDQFTLSTAWDVSSAGSSVYTLDSSTHVTVVTDMFISHDGKHLCMLDTASTDDIVQYEMLTAYALSTAVYTSFEQIGAETTLPSGLFFSPDGNTVFVIDLNGNIKLWDLGTDNSLYSVRRHILTHASASAVTDMTLGIPYIYHNADTLTPESYSSTIVAGEPELDVTYEKVTKTGRDLAFRVDFKKAGDYLKRLIIKLNKVI